MVEITDDLSTEAQSLKFKNAYLFCDWFVITHDRTTGLSHIDLKALCLFSVPPFNPPAVNILAASGSVFKQGIQKSAAHLACSECLCLRIPFLLITQRCGL